MDEDRWRGRVAGGSALALALMLFTGCGQTIQRSAISSICPHGGPCASPPEPSILSPPPASPPIVISPSISHRPKEKASPSPSSRTKPHPVIAVIVMENHEYGS